MCVKQARIWQAPQSRTWVQPKLWTIRVWRGVYLFWFMIWFSKTKCWVYKMIRIDLTNKCQIKIHPIWNGWMYGWIGCFFFRAVLCYCCLPWSAINHCDFQSIWTEFWLGGVCVSAFHKHSGWPRKIQRILPQTAQMANNRSNFIFHLCASVVLFFLSKVHSDTCIH